MGTSSEDGVVRVYITEKYYLKHKEVLDKFFMKGTSRTNHSRAETTELIVFLNFSPIGGTIDIENDPAFVSFLRLTGGM